MNLSRAIPLWVTGTPTPVPVAAALLVPERLGLNAGTIGPSTPAPPKTASRVGGNSGAHAVTGQADVQQRALSHWQAKKLAMIELTKPGITRMVLVTAVVGFVLGIFGSPAPLWMIAISFASCMVGTALSASGANALNQWWEGARDGLMERTRGRPIPSGRLHRDTALLIGLGCSIAGVGILLLGSGLAAALVSLATILSYVLIYTPMKVRSPLATLVGAVPGALPPLIGWCAARTVGTGWGGGEGGAGAGLVGANALSPLAEAGGWALFTLMFVWQLPHFLAIAWMYKDDYAKGGHAVLPVFDATGRLTAWCVLITAMLLVPVSVLPMLACSDRLGCVSATVAGCVSIVFAAACLPMLRESKAGSISRATAKRVFLASILHLPLVLLALVGETVTRMVL